MELLHSCSHFIYLISFTFTCFCGHRIAVFVVWILQIILSTCWLHLPVFLECISCTSRTLFFFFTEDSLLIFYLRSRCGWSMNHCICSIYVVMNKHVYTPLPTCTSLNSHKLLRSLQERSRERLFTRAYLQDKREWLQNERE